MISKVEQLETDPISGDPDCKLTNPVRILCKDEEPDINKRLVRWPDSEVSHQKVLMMHSDSILTIVEPHEKLVKAYEDFIKE